MRPIDQVLNSKFDQVAENSLAKILELIGTRQHADVVNLSGGKDSTATLLKAIERGKSFVPVFADTGNEHPATYDFVSSLPQKTGCPPIVWVKADFSHRFARRREWIAAKWPGQGVPAAVIERAIELMHPTGNPFLDLCMLKGRFPGPMSRFCTTELKVLPIIEEVQNPIIRAGRTLISWQGVRAQESFARSLLPKVQRLDFDAGPGWAYRPLLDWTIEDVFAMHARHGIEPNPLYAQGMSRVGCMPCMMARKVELRRIARFHPEQIDRIEEWERIVSLVSKRAAATFFKAVRDPMTKIRGGNELISTATHGIREYVEYAKTSKGGRQYDMLFELEDDLSAKSDFTLACNAWGQCE